MPKKMRLLTTAVLAAMWLPGFSGARAADGPEYSPDGRLKVPENFREWVFLSSGAGMTYGPLTADAADRAPLFDNVFVNPASYKAFLKSGHWPNKTIFVLEIRQSETHASINRGGHSQGGLSAVEAEVKDSSAATGEWTFYDFSLASGKPQAEAKPIARTASCYSCHQKNAAVENTFVQFYPVLLEVAQKHGTLNPGFLKDSESPHP